jgi:exocyst complex component 4
MFSSSSQLTVVPEVDDRRVLSREAEENSSPWSRYIATLASRSNQDSMPRYQDGVVDTASAQRSGPKSMGQAGSNASLASIADGGEQSNPEVESFAYIEGLLEALAVLGRLGVAMERLVQRAGGEIHALVEVTLDEVDSRIELRREEAAIADSQTASVSGNTILALSLDVVGPPHHAAILRDLFWTLYSKLVAVLEGHRVAYEVARWIASVSKREDRADSSAGTSAIRL